MHQKRSPDVSVSSSTSTSSGGQVSSAYIPPPDTVFRLTVYNHHKIYYKGQNNEIRQLQGTVNFLQKGYDIVGYGYADDDPVRPMRDHEGHVFVVKLGRRQRIAEGQMEEYGIVGKMPPAPPQQNPRINIVRGVRRSS